MTYLPQKETSPPDPLRGANILRLASSCGARISFCGTTSLRTFADIISGAERGGFNASPPLRAGEGVGG